MNGDIWVESRLGKGSTFHFTVQLGILQNLELETQHTSSDISPQTRLANQLSGYSLLLAEDNEINRELVIDLLSSQGAHVVQASNGKEALQQIKKKDFDAILMDCHMPVMDGYQATRIIRQQAKYKTLPILALTANVIDSDKERALKSGMDDLIPKPIDPDFLFATLQKWIDRSDKPQAAYTAPSTL